MSVPEVERLALAGLEPRPESAVVAQHHGGTPRGLEATPSSTLHEGRFGRMFRQLPAPEHTVESLLALAERIIAPAGNPPANNPDIPSGYTYLGQFIDHDITFDPVSSLQKQNDPDALHNFRTPRYDLDCLYGRGPADQPYLYLHGPELIPHPTLPDVDLRGISFRLGATVSQDPRFAGPDLPRDLPRDQPGGRALIGDPRNDENLIVSQLHVALLRFHNRMVERGAVRTPRRGLHLFEEAQRLTRWHYQWVVVKDFLPRVAGQDVVDDVLRPDTFRVHGRDVTILKPHLRFYHPRRQPFMPLEFSVAAYRFGHSMVRERYRINEIVPVVPIFSDDPDPLANLNGFRHLPDEWGFQWQFFFGLDQGVNPQPSLRIDASLVNPLGFLQREAAESPRSLAERNLLRGLRLGIPAGQAVARAMGIEPLTSQELGLDEATPDLVDQAPLWYYILKEAEVTAQGARLGPVGGRVVAEVLVGLLAGDPLSFLSMQPAWRPDLAAPDGTFTMRELLTFATGTEPPA